MTTGKTCFICGKKLRKDNTIGACRKHRAQAPSRKEYMNSYVKENEDSIKEYKQNWSKSNRETLNTQARNRYNTDINYRIKISIRNRINQVLKRSKKPTSAIKALGCSVEELRVYLESKFTPEMSWENHGTVWHIDHVTGLINFDLTCPYQYEVACHYTNLQPLLVQENLTKKKYI